jgi:hypothetical protein
MTALRMTASGSCSDAYLLAVVFRKQAYEISEDLFLK